MIYETQRGTLRATLAMGDMAQVSSRHYDDFFLLHTHPEQYLSSDGSLMGFSQVPGLAKTLAIQVGEVSPDTTHLLPSRVDLGFVLERAREYWRRGLPLSLGETPLYEPTQRLFRNWVVHPFGLSEVRISFGEAGQPADLQVRFAAQTQAKMRNGNYEEQKARLEALATEFGLPVTVSETNYDRLIEGLPFTIQSLR